MKKVTIIDYGCGNILSLRRAIEEIGHKTEITNKSKDILKANFLILPGVGAFSYAMNLLRQNNLIGTLNDYAIKQKKKILGVCLGMQLFMSKSFEMGEHKGLDFIEGKVVKINEKTNLNNLKIPHVSWNEIFSNKQINNENILNKNILKKDFYFVHSYIALTKKNENTIAYCKYFDVDIPAIVRKENIIGCQFHPDKSGVNGLSFLKKIIEIE